MCAVTLTALGLTTSQAIAAPAPATQLRPWQARHLAEIGHQHAQKAGTGQVGPVFSATAEGGGEDEGDEAENSAEATEQFTEARTAPGVVAPGAYGAAWAQLQSMPHTGGSWDHVTDKPYNSDDPRYRDINSNSSGGSGFVTGRITGVAADDDGYVYAGGANGGVFRSRTGGGHWQAISDKLPSLSTGALNLDGRGRLWYATGESNTGATSYVGTGVYLLADPKGGEFQPGNRIGGAELESTTIHALRFGGDRVWAATSRGVWSHSTTDLSGPWTLEFAPNPSYLPGGADAKAPNAPYKNIANDIAIDPKDPSKVVLAVGWRSGDTYNGFYSKAADGSWQRISDLGELPTGPATSATSPSPRRRTARATTRSSSPPRRPPPTPTAGSRVCTSPSPARRWARGR